ncbi:MAG: putative tyrosine-protein kinase [Frankiales bacterium]|nr:putative tyrosine-protein kinase [Frankiales bacterium]
MDLRDYSRIFRKRFRAIVAFMLLGMLLGVCYVFLTPKVYSAQAELFVSLSESGGGDSIAGLNTANQFATQRVQSYAKIINSPAVTRDVVASTNAPISYLQLAKRVTAAPPPGTVLIDVSVVDRDPARAQQYANAVALRFTKVVAELERVGVNDAAPVKVSVVRQAELPGAPIAPRPKVAVALGLLLGLAVGVAFSVLREVLDTTLKTPNDVTQFLGLPTLGAIAFDPDAPKRPLVVLDNPQSIRAESFRQLRTNLQFVNVDEGPKSLVVTSSVPGEGKTTTTCNLAIALAQTGLQVILVEGDLRRPRVADYMGLESAVGLTDVLIGRADLEDVLQPWGESGTLKVLASGPIPPNPSELLGSKHMAEVMRSLEGQADLVVVDAPPLLPVTDAAVLATETSGVVLLVRCQRTRREQAARALEALEAVGATVYGAVLNMVPTRGPDAYTYGYGYGYGYGYTPRPGGRATLSTQDVNDAGAARTSARQAEVVAAGVGTTAAAPSSSENL